MAYGTFAFGKKAGMLTPDSVNSLKNAISGLNAEQAALALSTRGLTTAQQNQVLVEAGLVASSDRISASFVKQALLTDGLDKEQQESILIKAGLMHEDSKLLLSGEAVSAQRLKQILIENGYQEEQAETLINSILQEGQNYKEALSWKVLGTKAKEAAIAMLHNPLTWIVAAIASVGLLVKGYDALIGKQEKLSRQKIEGLDEDISKLDEEIKTLEELQSKLEDAKGSRYELSQIQAELNDAIGETKGLLNGESKAWDVANAKLKANIELKKQQRKQAQQDRVDESKDLYDSNSMEIDWRMDLSGDKAREYAEALSWMNGKSFDEFYGSDEYNKLTNQQQSLLWEAVGFKNSYTEEWSNYWKEQIDTAYDVFEETISNYDGAGGQDFIKGLISDMVQDGASLSEISDVVTQVINNQDMQDAINKYWESLVNPDIDSEEALQAVKKIFDDIVTKNPALKDFFDNFYNGIVAGGKAATDTSSDVDKMTDSLEGVTKTLSTLQGKYNELKSAQDEYNSTGAISAETMQKLIDNDLLQYLDYSSGKLRINTDALLAEGEAAKVNAIQKLQDAMATDLMNLATDKTKPLSDTAKTAIANMGNAAETAGNKAETAASKLAGFAVAAQAAKEGAEGKLTTMSPEDFSAQADAIISAYTRAANSIGGITIKSPKTSGGSSSSSSKSKPDYEDPTDAIINRINLRSKEIEKQEEEIQNLIEIAELENDYKKQISLTNDKLDIQRQKVDALKTANDELHQMAEDLRNSTPDWNEEEWFDSQGNATEAYYTLYNNSSKEDQEKIKDQFEKISKLKKAWVENDEEIVDLNKEILQGEKEIVDLQNEYLEDAVSQIERHIDKIKEAKQDEIDKEEALLSIREKSYETLNKLADAQHEADKAIRTSRIAYQYLDEDMIDQIYNEEDYKRVSDKIDEVQDKLSEDTARFLSEVEDAYAQDKLYLVESITAEYERQCALKERELEILQAEIDLQKKQEQLNNVLAEKNVRLLKDGKWIWTHDADNARQAMEELADAQYEYERQQKEHQQQLTLDSQQRLIDGLTSEVSMLDSQVEKLNEVVENITDPLTDFSTLIDSIVSYGNKVLTDAIGDVHVGASSVGGSKYSSSNPAVKGSPGYYNSNPNYDYTNAIANAKSEDEVRQLNNERTNKIYQNQLQDKYPAMSQEQAVDYWKSKRGYASGTKHALPGVADFNEGNKLEGLITNDGTLIPMANFAGGEMVFSHEMMENLWHHAQIPWNIHMPNIPSFETRMPSIIEKGQSFYGDINVYNPTDWNDFMRQLNAQTKSQNAITNRM